MKDDRFLKIYGFLHLWIFAAGILLLLLNAGGVLDLGSVVKFLFLAASAVFLREISVKGKKIWSYLGALLLVFAVFWFLGQEIWERVCFLLGVFLFAFLFFWQRIIGDKRAFFRPSYACLLVFFLEYIFSWAYGLDKMGNMLLVFTGCYWLLILWSRNREHFLDYCAAYDKLYRFPKQGVVYGSRLMLIFLTVLTAACMALLPFLEIDRGILSVLDLLRNFLSMIFSGQKEEEIPEELPAEEMTAQPVLPKPDGEPWAVLTAVWKILEKIFTLAVILGVVAGICIFLIWLYKKYNGRTLENGDILESLDSSEKEIREKIKKKRIFVPSFLKARTPRARIRKSYRQKIEKSGKPFAAASPKELEDLAGLPEGEKREEFHRLYEKARYGNIPCTYEEAKHMHELERVDFF